MQDLSKFLQRKEKPNHFSRAGFSPSRNRKTAIENGRSYFVVSSGAIELNMEDQGSCNIVGKILLIHANILFLANNF